MESTPDEPAKPSATCARACLSTEPKASAQSPRSTPVQPDTSPRSIAAGALPARETMTDQSITLHPVAHVIGGRVEPTDDYWGGTQAIIRIDDPRLDADSTKGLEEFSHIEVVFYFHLTDQSDLHLGARSARNNPDWPAA